MFRMLPSSSGYQRITWLLMGAMLFSPVERVAAQSSGEFEPDYMNTVVDGPGDLSDFFPIFLDIKQLLTVLPPGPSIKYKLKHEESGLNFVYTSLTRPTSFAYKSPTATTGYGPDFDQAAAYATTEQITAAGVELSAAFLTRIKEQDQGVILVEMRGKVGKPLKLVVEKDNVQISEVVVNLASWRFYADAGKIHLGFDPPNKGEPEDRAAPTTYWASVVQGETNAILNLDIPANALTGIEWKVATGDESKVDITPKSFTQETTDITITGLNTGSNTPQETTINLVESGRTTSPILTLKVRVLPPRAMGLAIYILEDPNAPLTQHAIAPIVELPGNAEILAACNDAFRQAGVRFTLHPSSGTYQFPYDTRGFSLELGYSDQLPARVSNGRLDETEKEIMVNAFGSRPAAANTIFPVSNSDPNNLRVILIKESGVPYNSSDPSSMMVRGLSSGIILFSRNLPRQIPVAAAHEIGHKLGLSTANDDGGGHDQPPFTRAIAIDQPNGNPAVFPGNDIYEHKPTPNPALMQSGTPEAAGLPWVYGRWFRHQDWDTANKIAGGIEP